MNLIMSKREIFSILFGITLTVMLVVFSQTTYSNDNSENQNYRINSDISSAMNKAAIEVSNRYSDEGMDLHEKKDKSQARMVASLAPENMLAADGIINAKNSIASYRAIVNKNFQFSQRYQNYFRQRLHQATTDKEFWKEFNDIQAANDATAKQVHEIQNKSLDVSLNIIQLVENNNNKVHLVNDKFVFDNPTAAEKYTADTQEIADLEKQKNEILANIQQRDAAFKKKINAATQSETID